jgi:hypothetical protein
MMILKHAMDLGSFYQPLTFTPYDIRSTGLTCGPYSFVRSSHAGRKMVKITAATQAERW